MLDSAPTFGGIKDGLFNSKASLLTGDARRAASAPFGADLARDRPPDPLNAPDLRPPAQRHCRRRRHTQRLLRLRQRHLHLGKRRDRDPDGQVLVKHMVLAHIGMRQNVVAQRLRVAQPCAVAKHQPGMGPQHGHVDAGEGRGGGFGRFLNDLSIFLMNLKTGFRSFQLVAPQ